VTSRPGFSAQTLSVLAALCDQPSQWQHGYALAKQTGLKSGTLYPILIRLADRGLVEACWQAAARVPPRARRRSGECHEHAELGSRRGRAFRGVAAARRAAGLGGGGLGRGAQGAVGWPGGPAGSGRSRGKR
jgi:hypothetical protein